MCDPISAVIGGALAIGGTAVSVKQQKDAAKAQAAAQAKQLEAQQNAEEARIANMSNAKLGEKNSKTFSKDEEDGTKSSLRKKATGKKSLQISLAPTGTTSSGVGIPTK